METLTIQWQAYAMHKHYIKTYGVPQCMSKATKGDLPCNCRVYYGKGYFNPHNKHHARYIEELMGGADG